MTDKIDLAGFKSFELSPIKFSVPDIAPAPENGFKRDELHVITATTGRRDVEVCSILDSDEWALYGRNEDGTVTHLLDGGQNTIMGVLRIANPDATIYLKTDTDCAQITKLHGTKSFGVLPCRIGDNGVLEVLNSETGVEKWGLFAFHATGDKSKSYVELGRWSNKEAAYFALSAIIYTA